MSSDSSRSVKIRLDIEVPQGGPEPVVRRRLKDRPFDIPPSTPDITYPANGNQKVNARQDSQTGLLIICTAGTKTSKNRPLFYQLSSGTTTTPASQPPVDASWLYPNPNGEWSFELPLPSGSGPYTLVMWNDDDDFDRNYSNFNVKNTGVTDCGTGTGGALMADFSPGVKIPATLYAHISNAGASSKVYRMAFDPQTKAWTAADVCGPHGFRLLCLGEKWQLHVRSEKIYPASSAQTSPSRPFQVLFRNVELGTCDHGGAGGADVEILVSR